MKAAANLQYYKFSLYGFLKNLRFFDAFILLFFLEKGLNYAQLGILYSFREVLINLWEIPSGVIADVIGRRRSMLFSFSCYILSFLMFYFLSSFFWFFPAMLLFSLGEAFRTGTHKAMIFDYLKINGWEGDKAEYYGRTRGWSQAGSALSALMAAGLVLWQGSYSIVFLFSVIPYVLDMMLMISYPPSLDGPVREKSKFVMKTVMAEFKKTGVFLASALKQPRAMAALSDSSLFSGYLKAVKDFLQVILQVLALSIPLGFGIGLDIDAIGQSAIFIGLSFSGIYVLSALASRNSKKIADLFSRPSIVLLGSTVLGLIFSALSGLFYRFELVIIAVVLFVFLYIIENLRKPLAIAAISNTSPAELQASILSVESQLKTIFAAGFSLVLGFSSDVMGLGIGLIITAATAAVVVIAIHILMRMLSNKRPE